ncbi:probable tubulin polyglutamylase TTLL9 isoform X5 [Nerophis lumbriciformis]|uniref:probable tubulin polyglutamylase TTLL9 isoform X5 n=1 Tax=Nerophis lumbriciformis TaxID=546530 RepID=UPI002ADF71FC|nr:probable tubulin polyglutamylase TTLL9 isoform X5 [Nerophis lumbriciformis]
MMSLSKNKFKTSNDCSKPAEKREGKCVVHFKCGPGGTIHDVLKQRPGWVEVKDDGEWDFHWCEVGWLRENFDHSFMEEHVRINHFRNRYEAAKSQGAGIFLFRKLKDIMDWRKHDATRSEEQKDAAQVESYVAQRYIENPYLLGGRKFDLRVYVMVTSYFPLKAWLYREGFARLSSTRFSLDSIDDKYVHLTNVAVQKTAPDYDPEKGCKWKIQKLRKYLTAKHGIQVVETLFTEMDNIFISSLQSVQKIIINDKHCFELYGYDILLDENLKPWLIEVNASPSLAPSSQEDYDMKYRMLEDTVNIVDMEKRLTGKEKRVGGYDLMWNDGPVYREDSDSEIFSCSCLKANTNLGKVTLFKVWNLTVIQRVNNMLSFITPVTLLFLCRMHE